MPQSTEHVKFCKVKDSFGWYTVHWIPHGSDEAADTKTVRAFNERCAAVEILNRWGLGMQDVIRQDLNEEQGLVLMETTEGHRVLAQLVRRE